MSRLGNNAWGRWTQLIGALNRLAADVRRLDRRHMAWEPWEEEAIRELFPIMINPDLAVLFGRSANAIKRKAYNMGLNWKLPEVYKQAQQRALNSPRAKATRFRKGNVPQTWKPIGTEIVDCYGYRKRKVRDGARPAVYNWEFVHVLVWQEARGPVPPGHVVAFRNGNKTDIRLENLQLLSFEQNMRRNSIHQYPPEVVDLMMLKGRLTRVINEKEKAREKRN